MKGKYYIGRLTAIMLLLILLVQFGSRAQATTTIVYDDTLTSGWTNWSWASVNLAATSPTHSGSASIAVTYTGGWQGASLAYPGGLATGAFTQMHFYLHGGSSGGQQIQLHASLAGGSNGPAISLPAPAANSWSQVQINLSDLGVTNGTLTGLVWQDSSGSSQPTFYIDDITFSDGAHPDGPVFGTVSLQRSAVLADGVSGVVVKAAVSDPQGSGDIASVTLNGAPLGRGTIALWDDGRHNDGPADDGVFGAVVTAAVGTPASEVMLTLTARDQASHTTVASAGALVILATPGGSVPAALPSGPTWGTNQWGDHWQANSGVPWQYVYQYITYNWYTDGWGGNFVGRFAQQAWDEGYVPVITVYLILGLPPECGEGAACYAGKLQNATAVSNYLAAIAEAASQASGSQPVIFHLEPDFYGFMQTGNYQNGVPQPDNPANYPVALNISGYSNDLSGFGRRVVDVIHQTAPNALVAPHASVWATNTDANAVPVTEVTGMAQSTAAFVGAMGGAQADLYFVEWSDRDSGCDDLPECTPQRPWWDTTNQMLPRPTRWVLWANALSAASGKRLILWQVPSGNMSLDNTCLHYQDNRPAYAFSHVRDLVESGVAAVLFGGGASCSTEPSTDGGFIQAQGAIAYDLPAAPDSLVGGTPTGPIVPLHWAENSEPDLWGYQVSYQPVGGGATTTVDVGIGNATSLLLPVAGQWQVTVAAYDAMGQVGPASSPIIVTTSSDAEQIFLPVVLKGSS